MVLVYSSLSVSVFVADLVVCSSNFSMPGASDTDACVENPLLHEDACAYVERHARVCKQGGTHATHRGRLLSSYGA